MKKKLKVYYEAIDTNDVIIADAVYCCAKMRRNLEHFFEVGRFNEGDSPTLMLCNGDNVIPIDFCPFCTGEIIVKPSRLGDKE